MAGRTNLAEVPWFIHINPLELILIAYWFLKDLLEYETQVNPRQIRIKNLKMLG